jgi:hypothetical protein
MALRRQRRLGEELIPARGHAITATNDLEGYVSPTKAFPGLIITRIAQHLAVEAGTSLSDAITAYGERSCIRIFQCPFNRKIS